MSVVINEFEVVPAGTGAAPAAPAPRDTTRTDRQVEHLLRVRKARAERLRAY